MPKIYSLRMPPLALILSTWTQSWTVQTRLYEMRFLCRGVPYNQGGGCHCYAGASGHTTRGELNSLETMSNPLGLDEILRVLDEMLACADKASWNAIAMQM